MRKTSAGEQNEEQVGATEQHSEGCSLSALMAANNQMLGEIPCKTD
jgi:hypothetical protein